MKYKLKNTDLYLNGKVIPEGSQVELSKEDSENLSDYLEEIVITKTSSNTKEKTESKKSKSGEEK
jgi:hypothetical protein